MPPGTDAEARWQRSGRPWCAHQWAERRTSPSTAHPFLVCRMCGVTWEIGDPIPDPRQ